MPAVKNAAGYHVQDNMDLLDLFVGAEGTLGAVVEAELRLLPLPPVRWGVLVFLPSLPASLDLVRRVRRSGGAAALEFFDGRALELLRRQKATNPAFAELEEIPAGAAAAVYVEYHGTDEDAVTLAVGALAEDAAACGASDESTRAATSDREMERLKAFRHALPEAVNLLIGERKKTEPGLTKLGTDMAVPDAHLEAVVRLYEDGLGGAGLDSVMFGHIGNNHLHVNILPRSLADYEAGKALYLEWARAVVAMGGSVSAEHGIGKLKVALLETLYGVEAVRQMRAVKRVFDPQGRMCPGNLFAPEAVL
jgi:D-lactate dehydrogenase (cytochrome)